jgi:tetratricopeptide (TPR) repeat protein
MVIGACSLPATATCGGGGGGGGGGLPRRPRPQPGSNPAPNPRGGNAGGGNGLHNYASLSYQVPWQHVQSLADIKDGVFVCWIPASTADYNASPLQSSRALSLQSGCVNFVWTEATSEVGRKYASKEKLPIVLLIKADGSVADSTAKSTSASLLDNVENLVQAEASRHAQAIDQVMQSAKQKAAAGDTQGAADDYKNILKQRCSTYEQRRDAYVELQRLGGNVSYRIAPNANLSHKIGDRIDNLLQDGASSEASGKYRLAERQYSQAHRLDPSDPVPLRYLGELYRHQTGDWKKAREMFDEVLASPNADPLSRAVALHGLGKMTIHEGDFPKGLQLMEQAVATYPLALAYRNLAVYWLSEGDKEKAWKYTQQALAVDPDDNYNKVFTAVLMASAGHASEALKIAEDNIGLLPASYNLAAIFALNGQKEKALALLKRHFFQYERYKAVRGEEMMEARVDAVFVSLRKDPDFIALTSGADGKLTMPAH